jgi:hypothetical protein
MVINETEWGPDTCECVLSYIWDRESSENHVSFSLIFDGTVLLSSCSDSFNLNMSLYNRDIHLSFSYLLLLPLTRDLIAF